jgi:predicted protein tyrosine phosphatase
VALFEKDLADAVALAAAYDVDVPVARLLSHFGDVIFQVNRWRCTALRRVNASRAVHDPSSCCLDLPGREMPDLRRHKI